jgi:hypothetical protein
VSKYVPGLSKGEISINIPYQRLFNQHITRQIFQTSGEVVQRLGAVQSQDYAAAKWAIALRAKSLTDADLDRDFADGTILRTHVMRPTWHFVARADIRWLLALTAPRVHAANTYQYRRLELDTTIFTACNDALIKALRDGNQLTRSELASVLWLTGIDVSDLRLAYLILSAELDGIVCSGARRGKQFTYALLDDRVPATKIWERDEALAELARRYFESRGPATEDDFIWWSGLSRTDVRRGLELIKSQLAHDSIDGKTYWFAASMTLATNRPQNAYLLPNYDEYVVGYTDRSAIFDSSHAVKLDARRNPLFQHTIVLNGQISGTWKRNLNTEKKAVRIELNPFAPLTNGERNTINTAAEMYAAFLEIDHLDVLFADSPLV